MNLQAVIIANVLGVLLAFVLLSKKSNSFDARNIENRFTTYMLIIAVLLCVLKCMLCVIEGKSGMPVYYAMYIIKLVMYVSNIIFGYLWVFLVAVYFRGEPSRFQKWLLQGLSLFTIAIIIINFINPVLFYIDSSNNYHRGDWYMVFAIINFILIVEVVLDCIIARREGGIFVFFPVWQFIMPVVVGIIIQNIVDGVSLIWPCIIISICAVRLNFQSESSYKDRLTGLYNRYYLDILSNIVKENASFALIMLDLNSFKQINDNYGHQHGDNAIYSFAIMLKSVIGRHGVVLRFAGDEFIVFLNSNDEAVINGYFEKLNTKLAEFKQTGTHEYELSYSYGYCLSNADEISLGKMIGIADKMMYENKAEFYRNSKDLDRRTRN